MCICLHSPDVAQVTLFLWDAYTGFVWHDTHITIGIVYTAVLAQLVSKVMFAIQTGLELCLKDSVINETEDTDKSKKTNVIRSTVSVNDCRVA